MTGAPNDVVGEERAVPDGHTFSLLLTHDVDRPYKTYQSLYYAMKEPERWRYHLSTAALRTNPYWQFESLMELEADLGVRSAFYFLTEQRLFPDRPLRDWFSMDAWRLFAGRYSLSDPAIQKVVGQLDDDGWEVGLHGSYESYCDRERLRTEKDVVEDVVGHEVLGGRQHYLNLSRPETWEHHRTLGLSYDATLGSSDEFGFQHGYGLLRPFDDDFVVFPLTIMEQALPDPDDDFDRTWDACEQVLTEARDNSAVMTVLWHPRHFSENDFPGHRRLYQQLIERALDLGAWVGSPGELYEREGLDEPPDGGGDPNSSNPGDPSIWGPADDRRKRITNHAGAPDGSE